MKTLLKLNRYKIMQYKYILVFCFLWVSSLSLFPQELVDEQPQVENENVELNFLDPKQFTIADITVEGADVYEDYMLINYSGLTVGQQITLPTPPGQEITQSIKKFWELKMFSAVDISWTKLTADSVWLKISLETRPRVSKLTINGLKKSEKEDLEPKLGISKEKQISPNLIDRAKLEILRFLEEKGYSNPDISITLKDDAERASYVLVNIDVERNEKTKVRKIIVEGNEALTEWQIDKAMKKTNDNKIQNIFRSKKFIREKFEEDKLKVIEKYNEHGYRDAYIVSDSVVAFDSKTVDVYLKVNEGQQYYFGDISWIGNTVYPYEFLNEKIGINKGDTYNYKLLMDRLQNDQHETISKYYQDNGYLFSSIMPVETSIVNDTINFEMRIHEGKQATINNIKINGNTRVHEHVIRRELFTKPGELYRQTNIIRSLQYLAQMEHFENEKIYKDVGIEPDQENGTVDIVYNLETKSSDQIEFSAGWGAAGLVGSVGLKFTNFAIQNLFNKESYRHVVPQGEGQTFSIDARTNGNYYSSFSFSFLEPWLGGKRPNSLSISLYYSGTSGMSPRYYSALQNMYNNPYAYGGYNPYGMGGYGMGGMGGYGGYYDPYGGYGGYGGYNSFENEIDKNKYFRVMGASIGHGMRVKWPDNYFTLYGQMAFQRYMIKDWYQMDSRLGNGNFNDFNLFVNIGRNSTDNPLFTRSGSDFSLGVKVTPPYSVINGGMKNGKPYDQLTDEERYRWLEYHKWDFSAKTFTSLLPIDKTPVLMTRAEFAYIGHFNDYARTPLGTYMFGGDGMMGYAGYGSEYISMRGYETNSLTPADPTGYRAGYLYNKFTMELRYPLSLEQQATIWALGFLEAGNSFNKIQDYNPFKLKRSAGVGVRIFLPMFGIMGIDWGYGFDSAYGKNTPHGSQFHFVIGRDL